MVRRSIITVVLVALAWIVAPEHALAQGCLGTNYTYAGQDTTAIAGNFTGCPQSFGTAYYGWTGVHGQITTPASVPSHSGSPWHSLGYLDILFNSAPLGWIQIGYYTGTVNTLSRLTTYGLYLETTNPITGAYSAVEISPLSFSSNVTYRILYDASTGCWRAYYNYSTEANHYCNYQFTSARMDATAEALGGSPGSTGMTQTYFGVEALATNATLRLLGSAGWQDWDTTLQTRATTTYDDRTDSPRNFRYSQYHSYWHFTAYSNN